VFFDLESWGSKTLAQKKTGGEGGSRTQTFNFQLTANDDVAASAKFQLEAIGVRTVHFPAKFTPSTADCFPALLSFGPRF
jgi:hypothetical protein